MSKTIGIFQGKQAKHNISILQTLYDVGPLTVWEITGKITKQGKISLHATLNKRIRDLEKKGYVAKMRNSPKWFLTFKGFMANLVLQKKYRKWADAWDQIAVKVPGYENLRDSNQWETLARNAKKLLEEGVINWDLINNQSLAVLLLGYGEDILETIRKKLETEKDKNF